MRLNQIAQTIQEAVEKDARSPKALSLIASKSPKLIARLVSDGKLPDVKNLLGLCEALGLEFYIGPPRGDAAIDTVVSKHKPEPSGHDDVSALRLQVADLTSRFNALAEKLAPENHSPSTPAATPDLGDSIDHNLLALIIERVEVRLKKLNRELPPDKKAALYLKTYAYVMGLEQRDREIDWDNVIRLAV